MQTLLRSVSVLALFASFTAAQITKAPASPRSVVKQEVGLIEVTVDYGRPGVKGRPIVGGLLPYGKLWRTGANASTKVTFSGAVRVAGNDVPAGTYALYTIPGEASWTVILHSNPELWGAGGYDPKDDLVRFEVAPTKLADLRETFTIDFQGFHANGADMVLAWEHTRVAFPLFADTDARVLAEIDERVRQATGPVSSHTYFDAATFLFEKQENMDEVVAWMDKAVELAPNAFWILHFQAEVALHTGDLEKARAAAERSLQLAKESEFGDFGYIAKNELVLQELDARRKR